MSAGPARALDKAREDIRSAANMADTDSRRRNAWTALDSAIRVMSDEASSAHQRRAAFSYVQQAHALLDHPDTDIANDPARRA